MKPVLPLRRLPVISLMLLSLASAGIPGSALAQYVWLDDKGTRQYSDMPPPSSVPANRILKQPRSAAQSTHPAEASTNSAVGAPPARAGNASPSTAEKDLEYRKRKAEQAEKEKKIAEETKIVAEKAKNCERVRAYARALQSGERIAQTDRNGERTWMSDEQRQREIREARRMLDECAA